MMTSGHGINSVELGVYAVGVTLTDGTVIHPVDVSTTVAIHGVAITFRCRGTALFINDHGIANVRIQGSVSGRTPDDTSV